MRKAGILLLTLYFALSGVILVMASSPRVSSSPSLFSVVKTDTSKNRNVEVIDNKMWFTLGKGVRGEMFGFQPGSMYYYEDLCRIDNDSSNTIRVWYTLTNEIADLYNNGSFWLGIDDSYWIQSGVPLPNSPGDINGVENVELEKGERSGPINFYIAVNPGQEMKDYSGEIIFHSPYTAPQDEPLSDPADPATFEEHPDEPEKPDLEEVKEKEPPEGEPDKPEEEILIEESFPEEPLITATPPNTGEIPPVFFYWIGIMLILAGMKLGKLFFK